MAKLIDEKLANLKAEAEQNLTKINQQIAGNAKTAIVLQARKVEAESLLAEFNTTYPAIVAKAIDTKIR